MKKLLCLLLCICIFSDLASQSLKPAPTAASHVGNTDAPVRSYRTRSYTFSQPGQAHVEALVWTGTNPSVYWKRTDNTGAADSSFTLDLMNVSGSSSTEWTQDSDIIVGDSGNTIIVVYQVTARVDWQKFRYNGQQYIFDSGGHVADTAGNAYGSPRIDIHEATGATIITCKSYSFSPKQEAFAITGSTANPTAGNAYNLNQLFPGLPTNLSIIRGPASVSILDDQESTMKQYAHFAISFEDTANVPRLRHLSMEFDAANNLLNPLVLPHDEELLAADTGDMIHWAAIDTWDTTAGFMANVPGNNYLDYWAVTDVHDDNNTDSSSIVKTFHGSSMGSNVRVNNITTSLSGCLNRVPEIAFSKFHVGVVWESEGCNDPLLDGEDIIMAMTDLSGQNILTNDYYRINDTAAANQIHPCISASNSGPFSLGYIKETPALNKEVYFKNLSHSIGLKDVELSGMSIYPNPAKSVLHIENLLEARSIFRLYNTQGALLLEKELKAREKQRIQVNHLSPGIYLLAQEGFTKVEKIVIQ